MRIKILYTIMLSLFFIGLGWAQSGKHSLDPIHLISEGTNSEPIKVTTIIEEDILLDESFEDDLTDWSYIDNDDDGNFWGIYQEDSDFDVAHSGSYGVGIYYNAAGNDDWIITPQIDIPENAASVTFSFWAHSHSTSYLEDFNVKLSTSGTSIADFSVTLESVTDVPSAWTEYSYDLTDYAGESVYLTVQCVSVDDWYLFADDFLITADQTQETTTLTGTVTDATNGEPIEGASVTVAGLSDVTDSDGMYSMDNVPLGSLDADFYADVTQGQPPLTVQFTDNSADQVQVVTASAAGYSDYTNEHVTLNTTDTTTLDISLSPELSEGTMRLVLNWDDDPRDLDSHLKTPDIDGSTYHVYYSSQGSATSPPYAVLDHDDTDGYGPETVTIHSFYEGTYYYYIYKYSGTSDITASNAVVQIYDEQGVTNTIHVPTTGTGRYWNVCTIDGNTQQVTIVNQIQESAPGPSLLTSLPQKAGPRDIARRSVTSWEWNFGDGSGSTAQNPNHEYTTTGVYTVSLTVTNDQGETDTQTKTDYISAISGGAAFTQNVIDQFTSADPWASYAGDIDSDGDMDVAAVLSASDQIVWYENDGNQDFTYHAVGSLDGPNSVFVIDLDSDGDMDLLSGTVRDDNIVWYENDGSQSFTVHQIAGGAEFKSIYALDIDNDGDVDVVSASITAQTVEWHENDGSQQFTAHTIANNAQFGAVYVKDVDGDGDSDVLSAAGPENQIDWFENDGSQNFIQYTLTTSAENASSVFADDMDSDGDMDILSTSIGDNTVAWYENDGSQNFTTRTVTNAIPGPRMVSTSDLNGDGFADIIVHANTSTDSRLAWYRNQGDGSFTEEVISDNAGHCPNKLLHVVDMDNDNDDDILTTAIFGDGSNEEYLYWYENNLTQVGIDDPDDGSALAVIESFQLHQNYPNPFNPVTSIQCDVPEATVIRVSVYDILGREVDILFRGHAEPGQYILQWVAGEQHSSGVYFIRMVTREYSDIQKVTLLK